MKRKAIASLIAIAMLNSNVCALADVATLENKSNNTNVNVNVNVLKGSLETEINLTMPYNTNSKEAFGLKYTIETKNDSAEIELGFDGIEKSDSFEINNMTVDYTIEKLNIEKEKIGKSDERVYYYKIKFTNLPCDIYNVSLAGAGFKTVNVDDLDITRYSKKIYINDNESFLNGDIDNNGIVDINDYNAVLENIDTTDSDAIKLYDLNRDGEVDIVDLSYVHENLTKKVSEVKVINTDPIIDTNEITLSTDSNQQITGTVYDLFYGQDSLKINHQDIKEDNPAVLDLAMTESVLMDEIIIHIPLNDNAPSSGTVKVYTEDGQVIETPFGNSVYSRSTSDVEGSIKVNLGTQVAVKKVSIVVTGTVSNVNLVEISKVEFLNNVYDEIPKPNMNIPSITTESGNEEITVNWSHEPNVTGYEVKCIDTETNEETLIQTTSNKVVFEGLDNYKEYKISIQSLNGDWVSGYSAETIAIPKPTSAPEAPEGVTIEGKFKSLNVSWKKHKNAQIFNLFYRKADTNDSFVEVRDITGTSYIINNLEDNTEYEVYLTATNELGESPNSEIYKGTTVSVDPPISPNYKKIDNSNIIDVTFNAPNLIEGYDENFDSFCIVDEDYTTSWTHKDWDTSIYSKRGPIITFNDTYTIDTISLIARMESGYPLPYVVTIGAWDEANNKWEYIEANVTHKNNNGNYAYITLPQPITTNKIQVNPSVYGGNFVSISELKFYNYDSLEDDVRDLFVDDLLIELSQGVTQDKIDELRDRANTKCPVSDEYHPNRDSILDELKLAEDILNDQKISNEIFTLNQNISNSGNNLGMSNDHQALGFAARAGEEIVVYVGTTGNVLPEIVFTQYYAESDKVLKTQKLKKGKNVIQVPEIHNMDTEKGGSIYVRYPNSTVTNNEIKIRVSNATKIPHLNLYGLINDEDNVDVVKDKIREYIKTLKSYTSNLESSYKDLGIEYDKRTSVMNTTDIELDKVTLNFPATAVLDGIVANTTSEDEQVDKLYNSLKAFEQLMDLLYAQRGVSSAEGTPSIHLAPRSRMNIKYQRMFIGAFMYASSHHVGIEYDSVAGLMGGKPFTFNDDGTVKESGQLFGWGIAHEFGHVTEIPQMTYTETTNNIIALLAQTLDDKSPSRLEEEIIANGIYDKVTSGTIGLPSNAFVKLGMFWQLHLAYDEEETSKMLFNPSFYSKLSIRYREATEEENKLSTEQLLVRCASDVAEKDLSSFFYSWGIKADEDTLAYLKSKGYEKETRKIQYLNDESRRQVLSGVVAIKYDTVVDASFDSSIKVNGINQDKNIKINLGVNQDEDKILGYEIYRNGQVVGFTTDNTFEDDLGALNNRVVKYEVVAYDYHLNTTERFNLGSLKISHDGTLSKSSFKVETNTTNDEDKNDEDICHGPVLYPAIDKVIDGNNDTSYLGYKSGNEDPYVIIDMSGIQSICGFKYIDDSQYAIENYEVYVSKDKENWTLANSGVMENDKIIYFNEEDVDGGKQLYTYEAAYVKLVAKGAKTMSIAEIDLIGPPGDNIEIGTEDNNYTDGIGILKNDYVYDTINGEKIPAGSIIITGEYRGNPAFNVAILKDENNNIVGGEQVLLAEVPENGHLGEISKGSYIYWIAPEDISLLTSKVKMEMYRVNNAITNEGQRLVSDTLYYDIPAKLPTIDLTGGTGKEKCYRKVEE